MQYYDSPVDLMTTIDTLLANATRRREISSAQKAFFRAERARGLGHVQVALRRALDAAAEDRAQARAGDAPSCGLLGC